MEILIESNINLIYLKPCIKGLIFLKNFLLLLILTIVCLVEISLLAQISILATFQRTLAFILTSNLYQYYQNVLLLLYHHDPFLSTDHVKIHHQNIFSKLIFNFREKKCF